MIKFIKTYLILILFAFSFSLQAQEVLLGLENNPQVKTQKQFKSSKAATEVILPFIDDFANSWFFPCDTLWQDRDAFINITYAYLPKSIGVATLDALNDTGSIYSHAVSTSFGADTLTSFPIRLDSLLGGSSQAITIADSVYFSFMFQPGGIGDMPEEEDSLILEFYAPSQNKWYHVWASPGMSMYSLDTTYHSFFPNVLIPITDTMYLQKDFQFRFRNIASISNNNYPSWAGNVDQWNLDYIYLDVGRNKYDTLPEDVAFTEWQGTLLKNYYSMPWNQFLANAANEMLDSVNIKYVNYSGVVVNLTKYTNIYELSAGGSTPYNPAVTATNINPYTENIFSISPFSYAYSSSVTENAEYKIEFAINTNTINDISRNNDSIHAYQRFYNFYAYDDGSAESGYGINGNNARIAYQFTLNTADTLRAIDMFFNQTLNFASQQYFYLSVWDDNGGKPGTLIYEQQGEKPEYHTGYNQFHTYVLDTAIPVSGTFYVGYRKTNDAFLHLGYDKNTDKKDNIFFNVTGTWYNSIYDGALMIRPILGDKTYPHLGIKENMTEIKTYPNPASTFVQVEIAGEPQLFRYILYNQIGQIVKEGQSEKKIDVNTLQNGLYVLRVFQKEKLLATEKIMIQH